MKKDTDTAREYEKVLKQKLAPFNDVPIIFVSALNKQRIFKALEAALAVFKNRTQTISTSKLNEWLQEAIIRKNPPSYRGKFIKIKYMTQLKTHYPSFALFCNYPQYVKRDYQN